MIKLENISKIYKTKHETIIALDKIFLNFEHNGLICIVGDTGSGKSTLLNLIGGVDRATSGNIYFNSLNYKDINLNHFMRNNCSFVFQSYNLIKDYNVYENIAFTNSLFNSNKNEVKQNVIEALSKVGLNGFSKRKIEELSGGQQQRVAIARALVNDNKLVLCDEPTGNLDKKTAIEIFNLLKILSKNKIIIIVTHNEEIASKYCDRLIRMNNGKIKEDFIINKKTDKISICENKRKINLHNIIKLSIKNLIRSPIISIIASLLIVIIITIFTSINAIKNYSPEKAFLNTLNNYGINVLPITHSINASEFILDGEGNRIATGQGKISLEYGDVEDDIIQIKEKLNNNAYIYPSYLISKNFQDFTKNNISNDINPFYINGFHKFVAIDDFNNFEKKLLYGSVPKEKNEVLIFDYVVYNLISKGVVEFNNISDIVDYTMKDIDTGFEIKISGVLKSEYESFLYLKNNSIIHSPETHFLQSLNIIFGFPAMIEMLKQENNYISVLGYSIYDRKNQEFIEYPLRKLYFYDILPNFQYIGNFNQFGDTCGIIISKNQFSKMFNIDENKITSKVVDEVLASNSFVFKINRVFDGDEKNVTLETIYSIIGVYDNPTEKNEMIFWENPDMIKRIQSGVFLNYYIHLSNNYKNDLETINKLFLKLYSNIFYKENPNFYEEDFSIYSPFVDSINEVTQYMEANKKTSQQISFILSFVLIIGISSFTFFSIKNFWYRIGVFKTMGVGNFILPLIFGLENIFIYFISFIISIFTSGLLINLINSNFNSNVNFNIIYFYLTENEITTSLFNLIPLIIITQFVSFAIIFFSSPLKLLMKKRD